MSSPKLYITRGSNGITSASYPIVKDLAISRDFDAAMPTGGVQGSAIDAVALDPLHTHLPPITIAKRRIGGAACPRLVGSNHSSGNLDGLNLVNHA
jgi:hypothetical protein